MSIDPSTLDSRTPRTLEGRSYPEHLRQYEVYDDTVLPLLMHDALTFDDLVDAVADRKLRAYMLLWLASARWRGLVQRWDPSARQPQTYTLTERGRRRLLKAS